MSSISLVPVTIDGVTYQANPEYTAGQVASIYQQNLQVFVDLFNMPAATASSSINSTTASQMSTAIAQLLNLAQNGVQVQIDPSLPPKTYYLSVEMSRDLDLLIQSLKASGATDPASSITVEQAKMWKSLAAASPVIAAILNAAISSSGEANRSLQALVELVYVKTGNEVMANSLSSLEQALSVTQDSLNILQDLQTLHNRLTVNSPPAFSTIFNVNRPGTNSDPSLFRSQYPGAASSYFGRPIDPTLAADLASTNAAGSAVPGVGFSDALKQLISLRERLRDQITQLIPITKVETSAQLADTLLGRLQNVVKDLDTYFAVSGVPVSTSTATMDAFHAFKTWMLDNLDQHNNVNAGKAGLIQQNITFAITSGESTNDSQKEEVRRYLFVFEEYYKSASAILQALTQIITKMAQNIAR